MKKRMSKRFLSMLLAVVMVVSMLPVTAFAGTASDAKEEISGVVNNVLDGVDFYYNDKVGVSMNFGSALDPNTLLTGYDVKAMGAVKLTTVGTGENAKLHADGEVYLHVPYSVFTKAYDTAAEMAMAEMFDANIKTALNQVYSQDVEIPLGTETIGSASVTAKATITLSGTLAQIIKSLLDSEYKHTATITYTASPDNWQSLVDNYVAANPVKYPTSMEFTRATLTSYNKKPTTILAGFVLEAFKLIGITTDASHAKAASAWASATVNAYDAAVAAGTSTDDVLDAQAKQLAAVVVSLGAGAKYPLIAVPNPIGNNVFKSYDTIRSELKDVIWEYIVDAIDADVQSFYGELIYVEDFPEYNETLTTRFTNLKGAIDSLALSVSTLLGKTIKIPLPIDEISSKIGLIEGMLKSAVATLNGTNADDEFINGAILGYNDTDTLPTKEDTGIYIVAGINSADIDDMAFQAHVIAPDLVRVEIQGDADGDGTKYGYADKGVFMQTTVGQAYNVKSTVDGTYNESDYIPDPINLMELRIDGLTTEGVRYADNSDEGDKPLPAPENAGVYTVLSIYLDRATLAMGADIAVLVVEPAVTAPDDFKFTTDPEKLTVPYDGEGHYPELTDQTGHATIRGAVNKEAEEAYILLDGFDVDSNVDAQVKNVEQILNALNEEAEKLHLPTANLTSQAMDAVAKLANFAKTKAEEAEDGGILTGQEVINYKNSLLSYLDDQKEKYNEDNLKAMSSKAYKAALDAIAQIKEDAGNFMVTDPTVQQYTALISTMLDAFEEMSSQATATPAAISTFALRSADSSAVTEIAASTPANNNEKVKLLAEKVVNTLLAKSGVNDNNVSAVVNSVLNYVGGVDNEVIDSKYYDDAVALVKTMGAAAGADDVAVAAAVAEVTKAFFVMYDKVLKLAQDAVNAHLTEGNKVYTLESIKAKIDALTKAEVKALAAGVLSEVSAFVSTVMDQAQAVVDNTNWTVNTIYFNIEPKEVGTYNCYAVNVNPNYVPNLTKTTLEILETVTITAKDQVINQGKTIDQDYYTVFSTYANEELTDLTGFEVALEVYDGEKKVEDVTALTAGEYTIKVTVAEKPDGKYALDATTPTVDGKLIITADEVVNVTATVDPDTYTIGDETKPVVTITVTDSEGNSITVEGLIEDTYTITKGDETIADLATAIQTAGIYTITPNYTDLTGYAETVVSATLTVKEAEVEECEHEWGEGVVTKEPTCTASGTKTYTCQKDDSHTKTETILATGHTDGDGDGKCDKCGHSSTCGEYHTPSDFVEENRIEATCDKNGEGSYDSVIYCTVCGEELSRTSHIIPQKACADGDDEDTLCDGCGREICTDITHEWITIPAKAPTCTEDGLEGIGMYCEDCDQVLAGQTVLSKLGHKYTGVVTTEPTCTDFGIKTYTCKNDPSHTYKTQIAKTDHEDENNDGACDNCGIPVCTEHVAGTPVVQNVVSADCDTPASYDLVTYCSNCGKCMNSETFITGPALGHKDEEAPVGSCDVCEENICPHPENMREYGAWVDSTCNSDAYTPYHCNQCGEDAYEWDVTVERKLHQPNNVWTKTATHHWQNCGKCGTVIYWHAHNFVVDVTSGYLTCNESTDGDPGCAYMKRITYSEFDDSHISDTLKDAGYTKVRIQNELRASAKVKFTDQETFTSNLLNLEVEFKEDSSSDEWEDGNSKHIPATGVEFTIDMPENADVNGTFVVSHMTNEIDADTGKPIIETYSEQPDEKKYLLTVDRKNETLTFKVYSVSPYDLAYNKASSEKPESGLFDLYGANVNLGNNLNMKFAFEKNKVDNWTGHYVEIVKKCADGRSERVEQFYYAENEWTDDGNYYVVTFTGIAAKEMSDLITVTVYNASGVAVSNPWEDSMRSYAMRMLNKTTLGSAKTVLVDMLNYGAEAQTTFSYGTGDLANSLLSDEQKACASGTVEIAKSLTQGNAWFGSNLSLKSNIVFELAYKNSSVDNTMSATIAYTNHKGAAMQKTIAGTDFEVDSNYFIITVDDLVVADARQMITVEICDASGNVVDTTCESIEDYMARRTESGKATGLEQAFMKFADSAYIYLHRNDKT